VGPSSRQTGRFKVASNFGCNRSLAAQALAYGNRDPPLPERTALIFFATAVTAETPGSTAGAKPRCVSK
jgi:hypothetical protein